MYYRLHPKIPWFFREEEKRHSPLRRSYAFLLYFCIAASVPCVIMARAASAA